MDADTMARGSVDPIFSAVFRDDQYVAGVRDFVAHHYQTSFNMGVSLLRPNRTEYGRLLRLLREDSVTYPRKWAEQGFLQAVYLDFVDLPFEFNCNTVCEFQNPDLWGAGLPEMRVIHFTKCKPWRCDNSTSKYCGRVDEWRAFLQRGDELAR
eukprot:UN1567